MTECQNESVEDCQNVSPEALSHLSDCSESIYKKVRATKRALAQGRSMPLTCTQRGTLDGAKEDVEQLEEVLTSVDKIINDTSSYDDRACKEVMQDAARKLCSFLPTEKSVKSILKEGGVDTKHSGAKKRKAHEIESD